MDFLTDVANWVSIVGMAFVTCIIMFKWAMGQFDTKKMFESVGILLVFCGGITITSIITSKAHYNTLHSANQFCQNIFPYTCAGWPMFSRLLSEMITIFMEKVGTIATLPSLLIGLLTSVFIWQKIMRGVWFGPIEVCSAFLSGIVFFISLSYFDFLKDGVFDVINSALSPFGDPNSGLREFVRNWENLNKYLSKVVWVKMDKSIFNSVFSGITDLIMGFFQQSITKMGINFLGLINVLFLMLQQAYMVMIPISIIKSVLTFECDWKVGLKSIFSYSFFTIALHVEGMLLSTFVSIDQLTGASANLYTQTSAIFYTAVLIGITSIVMGLILFMFVKKIIYI